MGTSDQPKPELQTGLGGVQSTKCLRCLRGWHQQCVSLNGDTCTCNHRLGEDASTAVTVLTGGNGASGPDEATNHERSHGRTRVRRTKRDDALKDQQSTGRKRAARLYPLHAESDCEWSGRSDCGGGTNPIIGCGGISGIPAGKQQARHHGPDKNTLNNEPGNVHRICHSCHNRWHAANDPDYDPNKPLKH